MAKVVLNNLYERTQLQDNSPANMLALVDGVPRTLSLDGFVRHWVSHQIDVIVRRSRFRLRKAEERLHILEGLLKAIDALDAVIALIRRSPTTEEARTGLMGLLDVDEAQAEAILSLQSASRSRRSPRSCAPGSRTCARSSPPRSASGASSPTSWPRSSRSTATSAAPGSCPSTAR